MNCRFVFRFIFLGILCIWFAGCGGSGGNSTPSDFTISGQVASNGTGLSGVTVTRTGNGSTTATTDSNGNYSFASVANGNYTLSAAITGYTMSSSQQVTVTGANVGGVNFTASLAVPPTFTISGKVTSNGIGLTGVMVTRTGNGTTTATTDSSGNYSFTSVANGNYTLSAAIAGSSQQVTVAGANVTGVSFTAALVAEPAKLNNPVILSQQNIIISTGSTNYLIQVPSLTNVSDESGSNLIDFSANQAAGVVQINGGSNTIIFRPGTTVSNLTVGGGSNTIYFPKGTNIVFSVPPPTSTSVLAY
jgi:hypothetical protein